MYALNLQDMQKMSDTDMKAACKIKTVNRASGTIWFNKGRTLSLLNYQTAAKNYTVDNQICIGTVSSTADLFAATVMVK
jgi:hypothetical protein